MKVKELIELLKTVDADREAVFADGMPVNGIHGELDEGALPLEGNPVVLSCFTLEGELENAQIDVEMWKASYEKLEKEIAELRSEFESLARYPG